MEDKIAKESSSTSAALKLREIDRDHQRVSKLKRYDDLDWNGINFPVSTKDISKFELRNRIGVNNVLVLDGKTAYICRKSGDYDRVVNLMIIGDDDKKHYVAIKSLGRLLSKMNSKRNPTQHFCSKLSKTLKKLRIEIDDLKSQKDDVEDKIAKESSSTSARFKLTKIRSMK